MESKMNIPKTLRVGYQKREDTYTKKLAYVIYIDEKGKVRKEGSWSSWRDHKMGVDDFENIPTSGFVMNKKVGDYKSDWNHRMAHIRIYDPRGFEFEIGVENLLYILEECSSIKGKGLEGEFVYAWSGTDLVLLPTTAQEYVSSRKFTDMKSMKVGKADMKPGCVYLTKDVRNVLYLGHEEVFELDTHYKKDKSDYYARAYNHKSLGKRHVFVNIDEKKKNDWSEPEKYWYQDGFTKLASKVSDVISTDFADEYDKWKKTLDGNQCKELKVIPAAISEAALMKDQFYQLNVVEKTADNKFTQYAITRDYSDKTKFSVQQQSLFTVDGLTVNCEKYNGRGSDWRWNSQSPKTTLAQILAKPYCKIVLVNDYSKKIEITN